MSLFSAALNPVKRTIIAVSRINPASISDSDTIFQDYLVIDATMSLTHNRKIDVTQFQVEEGSDISDNIRVQNDEIQMEGIVSNDPISLNASLRGAISAVGIGAGGFLGKQINSKAGSALGGIAGAVGAGAIGGLLNTDTNRVQNAFNFLESLRLNRTPFTVVTGYKVYENMFFTSLSFPKDASLGNALKFNASLTSIRIVESQTIKIKRTIKKVSHGAKPKEDMGKQKPVETVEKKVSILRNIYNFATGHK